MERKMQPVGVLKECGVTLLTMQTTLAKGNDTATLSCGDMPHRLSVLGVLDDAIVRAATRTGAMFGSIQRDDILVTVVVLYNVRDRNAVRKFR